MRGRLMRARGTLRCPTQIGRPTESRPNNPFAGASGRVTLATARTSTFTSCDQSFQLVRSSARSFDRLRFSIRTTSRAAIQLQLHELEEALQMAVIRAMLCVTRKLARQMAQGHRAPVRKPDQRFQPRLAQIEMRAYRFQQRGEKALEHREDPCGRESSKSNPNRPLAQQRRVPCVFGQWRRGIEQHWLAGCRRDSSASGSSCHSMPGSGRRHRAWPGRLRTGCGRGCPPRGSASRPRSSWRCRAPASARGLTAQDASEPTGSGPG